ncbi:MAG: translocation/assembly module TamB domain-containing protein [Gemmatimonadota bacterium]
MRRHVARVFLALVLGTVPVIVGLVTAATLTLPGRELLAREVTEQLSRRLRGRFEVGEIYGSFIHSLEFDGLVVRDTSGALLASFPHAALTYQFPRLLAGDIVLTSVTLVDPTLQIIKHPTGRLNFQEVLKLNETAGTGTSPLIEFRDVRITGGSLVVKLPWSPPDTVSSEASRLTSLAADRARPGRIVEESPEGLRKVLSFDSLNLRMPVLRISTPDHQPLTFNIDSLRTLVSDPAITVRDLQAHGWTKGDSLAFTISRGALPHTRFHGGGVITWPKGPMLYDFALEVPLLDLEDVRWVSPDFPSMLGHTLFAARSESETRTDYVMRDLHLRHGDQRVDGDLTAITDHRRGLGVQDMNLTLNALDLDAVRPYLDTLPLHGTLTGPIKGNGFFDHMNVDFDWTLRDARLPDSGSSHFAAAGGVVLGGKKGFIFDTLTIDHSDIDLRTVRLIVPAVILEGRLSLEGTLAGPWKAVTFNGAIEHHDGDRPVSRAEGSVFLDTRRDTLGLATDLELTPFEFDGVRRTFPTLTTLGSLRGHFRSSGTLGHLAIDAALHGEIGSIAAQGAMTIEPPKWGADSLHLTLGAVDLAELRGSGPHTRLTGEMFASGVIDSARAPEGTLEAALTASMLREFRIDTLYARGGIHDSLFTLDTLIAGWRAGRADGKGTLGYRAPKAGSLTFALASDSLVSLDSLVFALAKLQRDTSQDAQPLNGRGEAALTLTGSLDQLHGDLDMIVHDLTFQQIKSPQIAGSARWSSTDRGEIDAVVRADSIHVGKWEVSSLDARAAGALDSLGWAGTVGLGSGSKVSGGGRWWTKSGTQVISIDTLSADLPAHRWTLRQPADITLGDSVFALTPIALDASDGTGSMRLEGELPRSSQGRLNIGILGLRLQDVYAMLERDTSGVSGSVALDLEIAGTGDKPTIRGTTTLADANFGEFGAPFVQGVINYQDQRLETSLLLWRTGQQVLRVEAQLPLDLALHSVAKRQVAGPLIVRAQADSTDLGVLEAFTPAVRRVRGVLNADAEVTGTWDEPRLRGFVSIANGSMVVPALGIRLDGLDGRARLTGDSITLDTLRMLSGHGDLAVMGGIRLEQLTKPILNLSLRANDFRAIDVRNFLTLDATGLVRLEGPVFGAVMRGKVIVNDGNLHFADLITKRIVDIDNPSDSSLIDLDAVRQQKLGDDAFKNQFLESLIMDNVGLQMGESFWLRSGEANIQLGGTITVNKAKAGYRLDGTLNALRGNYTLRIGFVTRDFTVEHGTVRYFGTPDLNADLDIQARHLVRPVEGPKDEIPIIAKITGTLLAPKLALESTVRPPLSETELISYLMFGRPSFSLSSSGGAGGFDQATALQTAVSYLSSALSSELQRTLITDLGIPLDYIEIRPGTSSAGSVGSQLQVAQFAAGWQIGRKWFLKVNADLCTNRTQFYPDAEFRISNEFTLKASIEPTQSCSYNRIFGGAALSSVKYQVGFDLLWDREY